MCSRTAHCEVVLCQQSLRQGSGARLKSTSRRGVALVATEEAEPKLDHQRKQEQAEVGESLSEAVATM